LHFIEKTDCKGKINISIYKHVFNIFANIFIEKNF